MAKKETTILTIITIIVLVLLIYLLINKPLPSTESDVVESRDTPEDNLDLEDSHNPNEGLPFGAEGIADLPNVIFNVFGDVVEVGNDYVVISTSGQHMESKNPTQVTVYVVEDKFESTAIDPEEQILISGTNILDKNNNKINLQNLSSNMTVSVESNENIKNETEFNASIIKIIE